jgi:hypothetical protein
LGGKARKTEALGGKFAIPLASLGGLRTAAAAPSNSDQLSFGRSRDRKISPHSEAVKILPRLSRSFVEEEGALGLCWAGLAAKKKVSAEKLLQGPGV